MKRITLALALVSLAACSKSVTKNGNIFSQTDSPNPVPTAPPVGCVPERMGELLDFSVYVKEDLNLDRVNVSKRVAATDACVQHAVIGDALPASSNRADLAVAQVLGVNVAKIPHGKATYGKTLDKVRSSALGGFVKEPSDMASNLRKILDFSNGCDRVLPNTTVTRACRHPSASLSEARSPEICTLTIRGGSALNVATLSAPEIANVTTYVIDIPAGTTLVTNFPENRIAIFRGVHVRFAPRAAESPTVSRLFWNFPAADSVELTGTRFRGTVVAPDASVRVSGQSGEAGFWVRELKATDSNW